jgi:hypothetical protein
VSCPKANHGLQQESDSDADMVGPSIFETHNRAKEFAMRRDLVAIGERDHYAHPDRIMGHRGDEVEAIAREINHLANIFYLGKPGVKRPNVQWESDLQPFPATSVSGCLLGSSG